jgi:carboxylesterase type B
VQRNKVDGRMAELGQKPSHQRASGGLIGALRRCAGGPGECGTRARHATRVADPQWARAQAGSGRSKVFYYYFAHRPPVPPEERFVETVGKELGAYHGAELAYVFGNFVPQEWPWSQADRELARTVSGYWVNFATHSNPNGPGLPEWPAFAPNSDSVLYIDETVTRGSIPNQKYIALWDTFAAKWKAQ